MGVYYFKIYLWREMKVKKAVSRGGPSPPVPCQPRSEIDREARNVYRSNHGDSPCGDIVEIEACLAPSLDFDVILYVYCLYPCFRHLILCGRKFRLSRVPEYVSACQIS